MTKFYTCPNSKHLQTKKKSVNEKLKFGFGRVENVGKKENAGYQHFLLFPHCFKTTFLGSLKVVIVW